jgi:type I restriction enzyme S subunit
MLSVYRDYGVVLREGRDDNYNKPGEDPGAYRVVRRGDLVVNKMKTWQGSLGISDYDGIVSPAYFVARPLTGDDPAFLHHLLRSRPLIAEYGARSKGIRPSQWDLPWEEFQDIAVELPPLDTQKAIAKYLDRETARIDALIVAKRRLVALLEERFKAQLLDLLFVLPDRDLISIARLCSCLPGYAFPSTEFLDSDIDATRLLRGINVTPGRVRWDEAVYFPNSSIDPRLAVYLLRVGDLVIGMDRPVVQSGMRVAAVQNADVPALLVQRVARLRASVRSTNRYLRYLLMSPAFEDYFSPITTGVSVPHISEEQILGFKVPVLTLDEQAVTVAALEAAESKLLQLRTALQDQCDALDEHRQAVITGAVIGQLDICEAA